MKRLSRGMLVVAVCALSARGVAAQATDDMGSLICQQFNALREGAAPAMT